MVSLAGAFEGPIGPNRNHQWHLEAPMALPFPGHQGRAQPWCSKPHPGSSMQNFQEGRLKLATPRAQNRAHEFIQGPTRAHQLEAAGANQNSETRARAQRSIECFFFGFIHPLPPSGIETVDVLLNAERNQILQSEEALNGTDPNCSAVLRETIERRSTHRSDCLKPCVSIV